MLAGMADAAKEKWFAATSGEVDGLTVTVNYGPPPAVPAVSGIWVGRYSTPSDPDRHVTFALTLVQNGRHVAGVSTEPPSTSIHRGMVALVADWSDGRVSEGGMVTITKAYRDQPMLEAIRYEGQVHPDMRCWGGTWRSLGSPSQGTFVAYRTCRLQGWGL